MNPYNDCYNREEIACLIHISSFQCLVLPSDKAHSFLTLLPLMGYTNGR
jgi:hypothetical protein